MTSGRRMFACHKVVSAQIFLASGLAILMPDSSPLPRMQFPLSHPVWTWTTPTWSQATSTSTTDHTTPPGSAPPRRKASPTSILTGPRIYASTFLIPRASTPGSPLQVPTGGAPSKWPSPTCIFPRLLLMGRFNPPSTGSDHDPI